MKIGKRVTSAEQMISIFMVMNDLIIAGVRGIHMHEISHGTETSLTRELRPFISISSLYS